MKRDQIAALLVNSSEVASKARHALLNGGAAVVWPGTSPADSLARIYKRRLRLTRRTGQETRGLEHAVELLSAYGRPVRLGQIDSLDGLWIYMLFVSEDARSLIACTAVMPSRPTTAL